MKPVVLDASALLAMFYGEPGVDEMRALFHRATTADQPLLMTAVNWAEILYRIERRQGTAGLSAPRRLCAVRRDAGEGAADCALRAVTTCNHLNMTCRFVLHSGVRCA
jgi:predicted nucleic acid-binding protein